jgi:hypothetical protein
MGQPVFGAKEDMVEQWKVVRRKAAGIHLQTEREQSNSQRATSTMPTKDSVINVFEQFREDIDQGNDRRERLIKVTAAAKCRNVRNSSYFPRPVEM